MGDYREEINKMIVDADQAIQKGNIQEGLEKFHQAKKLAISVDWSERVINIDEMIEEIHNRLEKQKIEEERQRQFLEKLEQKKLEEEKLANARNRLMKKQEEDKIKKLELLKKKKTEEDEKSSQAYELLNSASNLILKNDFDQGLDHFNKALSLFESINWTAEVLRIKEFISDALHKKDEYESKLKQILQEKQNLQEKTQVEQDFIKKEKQNIQELAVKKKSQDKEFQEKEKLKTEIVEEIYKEINKIEKKVKDYQNSLKTDNILNLTSPYNEAEQIYSDCAKRLLELNIEDQSHLLKEGANAYRKKNIEDQTTRELEIKKNQKIKKEEELLQIEIALSTKIKQKTEKELEIQKQKEKDEYQKAQKIADRVFKEIEEVERRTKEYQNRENIYLNECPYPEAIQKYEESAKILYQIGWSKQADLLKEGIKAYTKKLQEDNELRNRERAKLAKIEEDKKLLEQQSQNSIKILYEKQQKLSEERKQQEEKIRKINAIAEQAYKKIEVMEKKVKEYESYEDIIPYDPPYSDAIQIYEEGAKILHDIGWIEQESLLLEGIKTYREKLKHDQEFRANEHNRIIKTEEEAKLIERRAEISKQLLKEKQEQIIQEKLKEELLKKKKLKISEDAFKQIAEIEKNVKDYEAHQDIIPYDCPYNKAILIYKQCAQIFHEIEWFDQETIIRDGIQTYKQKLNKDIEFRKLEKERLIRTVEEEKLLEQRSELSKKLLQEKQNQLISERKKEEEKNKQQQLLADSVFKEVEQVELKIKEYESSRDIFSSNCPYEEAISVYKSGSEKLDSINWYEQSKLLYEGMLTYKSKFKQDQKFRSDILAERIKSEASAKEIEEKVQKSREKINQERIQKQYEQQKEQAILKSQQQISEKVFQMVENIESKIKEYNSYEDIIPYECPYKEAIEIYSQCAKTLSSIGWYEQASILYEGMNLYSERLKQDEAFRIKEKTRIAKSAEEKELLEKRAFLSKKLAEEKHLKLMEVRKLEEAKKQQEQTIADNVFPMIEDIDSIVKNYESNPDMLTYECPYERAIEIYKQGAKILNDLNWTEAASKIYEGISVYRQKLYRDQQFRKSEMLKLEMLEESKKLIEKQAEMSQKLLEELERKRIEKQEQLEKQREEQNYFANQVFSSIDSIEIKVKQYESEEDRMKLVCPYENAIFVYKQGAQKLKELGWNEESARLFEGMVTYQEKLIKDRQYRKMEIEKANQIKKSKELLEEKVEESLRIKNQMAAELKAKQQAELQLAQLIDTQSQIAFELLDQGNLFASTTHEYEEAIKKYQEAKKIFKDIGWNAEIDKIDLQISIFEDQQQMYLLNLQKVQEKIVKEEEETAKLERLSMISKRIAEKNKQQQELRRKELEERKKKMEETEMLARIEEFQKMEQQKLEEQQKLIEKELAKKRKQDQINDECFSLLDEARTLSKNNKFDEAIEVYQKVFLKYKEINYYDGMRLTEDSIEHLRLQQADQLRLKQVEEENRKELLNEQIKIELLIKNAKEESERKLLEEQKKLLEEEANKEFEEQIQDQIITILAGAGELVLNHQYDDAIILYEEALSLVKTINWPLKFEQINSILIETKQKYKLYIEKETIKAKLKEREIQERTIFEQQMKNQEMDRKNSEKFQSSSHEMDSSNKDQEFQLGMYSYQLIDLAEKNLEMRKEYLTIFYLHSAVQSFSNIGWFRESEFTQKRLLDIVQNIEILLINVEDLTQNNDLEFANTLFTVLNELIQFIRLNKFKECKEKLHKVKDLILEHNWEKSMVNLNNFSIILEENEKRFNIEMEKQKHLPTREKAQKLIDESNEFLTKDNYIPAIEKLEKAHHMFIELGLAKEAREVKQDILRWKLKLEKSQSSSQEEDKSASQMIFLSEEERTKAIIEERKRNRRERRKT